MPSRSAGWVAGDAAPPSIMTPRPRRQEGCQAATRVICIPYGFSLFTTLTSLGADDIILTTASGRLELALSVAQPIGTRGGEAMFTSRGRKVLPLRLRSGEITVERGRPIQSGRFSAVPAYEASIVSEAVKRTGNLRCFRCQGPVYLDDVRSVRPRPVITDIRPRRGRPRRAEVLARASSPGPRLRASPGATCRQARGPCLAASAASPSSGTILATSSLRLHTQVVASRWHLSRSTRPSTARRISPTSRSSSTSTTSCPASFRPPASPTPRSTATSRARRFLLSPRRSVGCVGCRRA